MRITLRESDQRQPTAVRLPRRRSCTHGPSPDDDAKSLVATVPVPAQESIMPKKPDYLAQSIRKCVAPHLAEANFARRSVKNYYRIRGDLIDVILFSRSSWGDGFYLHYFVNPVFGLEARLLSSYIVGERLSQDADGTLWTAEGPEDSDQSVQSALNCIAGTVLPWFDTVPDIKQYLVKLRLTGDTAYRANEIVCLCALGRIEEALSLCESRREYFTVMGNIDRVTERFFRYYHELAVAANEGTIHAYLLSHKQRNLADAKIVLPE